MMQHAPTCIASQAWDIPEAYDHCSCKFPYPYEICRKCYKKLTKNHKCKGAA